MIDGHRNSLLQQHATQDIKLKGLFVQKPSSANQVRQAIAQAHPLTTQVGQVRLFASALNPYLNYINTVYECLYLNTFIHIFSNYCQPPSIHRTMGPNSSPKPWLTRRPAKALGLTIFNPASLPRITPIWSDSTRPTVLRYSTAMCSSYCRKSETWRRTGCSATTTISPKLHGADGG